MAISALHILIIVSLLTITSAFYPKKCSLISYSMAGTMCANEMIKDVMKIVQVGLTRARNLDPYDIVMNFFSETCKSGSLLRVVKCAEEVESMCGASEINARRRRKIVDILCNKMRGLREFKTCAKFSNKTLTCIRNVKYDPTKKNAFCTIENEIRQCIHEIFNSCNQGPQLIDEIIDQITFSKCVDDSYVTNECPAYEYILSTAQCWLPFYLRVAEKPMKGANALKEILCSDDLQRSLACQRSIDSECGFAIVDTTDAMVTVQKLCNVSEKIMTIPQCVDYRLFPICASGEVLKMKGVCDFYEGIKRCYTNMFTRCDNDIHTTMMSAFELIQPTECSTERIADFNLRYPTSSKDTEPKCTMVAHLASNALCWMPTAQSMLLTGQLTPREAIESLNDQCESGTMAKTTACHDQVDSFCKFSLLDAGKLQKVVELLCLNPNNVFKMTSCFQDTVKASTMCSLLSKKVTLDSQSKICSKLENTLDCSIKSSGKSPNCTASVKPIVERALNALVPMPCSGYALAPTIVTTTGSACITFIWISIYIVLATVPTIL